jgi:hypothetical protein
MSEVITVFNPPIPCDTPFGRALCLAWYDYGFWCETQWKCCIQHNGAIVFVPHTDIRMPRQYSARVDGGQPPDPPQFMVKLRQKESPN